MIDLDRVYHERLRHSGLEQLTDRLRVERLVQTQSSMWAKSVARFGERQAARDYPVVQRSDRTVRFDRKHDDVSMHESLRCLERERNGEGGARNGLEFSADLVDSDRGRDRPRTRRSGQRDVRWPVPGKPRVVSLVDLAYPVRDFTGQLRDNEDPIQLQASLGVTWAGSIRTEMKKLSVWIAANSCRP